AVNLAVPLIEKVSSKRNDNCGVDRFALVQGVQDSYSRPRLAGSGGHLKNAALFGQEFPLRIGLMPPFPVCRDLRGGPSSVRTRTSVAELCDVVSYRLR